MVSVLQFMTFEEVWNCFYKFNVLWFSNKVWCIL